MKKIVYACIMALAIMSCKSTQTGVADTNKIKNETDKGGSTEVVKPKVKEPEEEQPCFLSSRLQLTVPAKLGKTMTVNGSMKMICAKRVLMSLLMPILHTEVARVEVTPDEVLLVDRLHKRYFRGKKSELKNLLPEDATFYKLEELIKEASRPGGKNEMTAKEVGLDLDNAKIKLYDFSEQEFELNPTEVSSSYKKVSLQELTNMLKAL